MISLTSIGFGKHVPPPGGGYLELCLLASQSPYPIIVYFLANYRPHLGHFLENVILVTFYLCIYLINVVSGDGM